MAEGNNFIIDIIAKLQTKISQAQLNGDIKSIQNDLNKLQLKAEIDPKSIKDLQKRIETIKVKAELDPNAVQNIIRQLENITNQKIVVSNINIDQGQTAKSGQMAGKTLAENLNRSLAASLNTVKQNIANILNVDMNYLLRDEESISNEEMYIDLILDSLIQKLSCKDKEFVVHMINGMKLYYDSEK